MTSPRVARWLVRLYPRRWRERYGEEFAALLEADNGSGLRAVTDVMRAALSETLFPTLEDAVSDRDTSLRKLLGEPTAFLPISMSLGALAVVLFAISITGVRHGGDEDTAAHLWQLLMAGQAPLLLAFVLGAVRRAPRPMLGVLALQAGAALVAMAPVFLLGL